MSARLLLEIALRVMGLWFFLTSITTLASTVSILYSVPTPTNYIWGPIATAIVQFLLGGALVFWAPAIAAWFYPPVPDGEAPRVVVGPGDLYRTACFVLGVYLLVTSAHPAVRLLSAGLSGSTAGRAAADSAVFIVYASSGLLLVFGSRRIAEMLSNLRYDPDTIPKQQISLVMVLIFIVLIAVVLGVFRMLGP